MGLHSGFCTLSVQDNNNSSPYAKGSLLDTLALTCRSNAFDHVHRKMQLLCFLNPRLLDLCLEDAVLDELVHKKPHGLPSSLAFLFRARDEA